MAGRQQPHGPPVWPHGAERCQGRGGGSEGVGAETRGVQGVREVRMTVYTSNGSCNRARAATLFDSPSQRWKYIVAPYYVYMLCCAVPRYATYIRIYTASCYSCRVNSIPCRSQS